MRTATIPARLATARERNAERRSLPVLVQVLAIIAAAALLRALPVPLLMPILSLVTLGAAMLVAVYAGLAQGRREQARGAWQVAGLLAFAGFGAGMLSRPVDILHLFGVAPVN